MNDSELTDAKMAIAEKLLSDLCEPQLCEKCKYFLVSGRECYNGKTVWSCTRERKNQKGKCGPEGKLFEAKEGRSDV